MWITTACTAVGYAFYNDILENFVWSYFLVRAMEEQVPSDPIEYAYNTAKLGHDQWIEDERGNQAAHKSEKFDGNINSYFNL